MPGLLRKRNEREEAEIPTSAMADIAFLLLIFFLVTTTIDVDTGIGMTLPPPLEEEQEPPPVRDRNILKILVNAEGQVLVEEEISSVGQIRDEVKTHVANYGQSPDYSESPDEAVISIKTDAETPYSVYIDTIDEVWMAYQELWDSVARTGQLPNGEDLLSRTYTNYDTYQEALPESQQDENPIHEALPPNISIAEPEGGDEG